jgi:hypothetical protein
MVKYSSPKLFFVEIRFFGWLDAQTDIAGAF